MIKTQLQHRVQVAQDSELRAFSLDDEIFVIVGDSPNRDLIDGDGAFWTQQQYIAVGRDKKQYEVYVYYYTGYENNKSYAVVDAIRDAA